MSISICSGCGKRRRTKPGTPIVCQCYVPGTKEYKARKKRELAALAMPAPTLTLSQAPRYRMIQDESCHWYVIQVGQLDEFNLWQDAMSECEKWDGFDFETVRVNGPHTVTFPEWKEEM